MLVGERNFDCSSRFYFLFTSNSVEYTRVFHIFPKNIRKSTQNVGYWSVSCLQDDAAPETLRIIVNFCIFQWSYRPSCQPRWPNGLEHCSARSPQEESRLRRSRSWNSPGLQGLGQVSWKGSEETFVLWWKRMTFYPANSFGAINCICLPFGPNRSQWHCFLFIKDVKLCSASWPNRATSHNTSSSSPPCAASIRSLWFELIAARSLANGVDCARSTKKASHARFADAHALSSRTSAKKLPPWTSSRITWDPTKENDGNASLLELMNKEELLFVKNLNEFEWMEMRKIEHFRTFQIDKLVKGNSIWYGLC